MRYWDLQATRCLNALAGTRPLLDFTLIGITQTGPYILVTLIALRWFSRADRLSQRHQAIRCGLATALGLILNQGILLFYQRPRPYESGMTRLLVERTSDPSFPSDHATVGFAIAVSLLLTGDRRRWPYLGMAILLGLSRIYVGTHYLTDVLGGAFTGAIAATSIRYLYGKMEPLSERLVRIL